MTAGNQPRLEWLEIRGFRAFGSEPRRMDLTSNLVVIHAGNSQGKTSLAEAVEFLLTGRSSRRDLFGGAKAEYNASLRNAHLPADDPVWVAAGILDEDGKLREVRRDLLADFSGATDCESRLTIDGEEVSSLSLLGIGENEGAIAAPVLLQHTLRYVLSTEPKQRANYFKALLALSDLDLLRERVRAQAAELDKAPTGPGLAAVQRLARTRLADTATAIQHQSGDRETLRRGIEQATISAGCAVLSRGVESVEALRTALEQETRERHERVFPLAEFATAPIPDLPAPPDLSEYLAEVRRTDSIAATVVPVLTAVMQIPGMVGLDHAVECPVCLAPQTLTPQRITEISARLRDSEEFSRTATAAERAVNDFHVQLRTWCAAVRRAQPVAETWNDERTREVTAAASDLGEGVPTLLESALSSAKKVATDLSAILNAARQTDLAAEHLADLIRRRADIRDEQPLDLNEVQELLTAFRTDIARDEAITRLRAAVEPLLRSRLQADGTQDLLQVVGLIDDIVDERHAALKRSTAQDRLGRADRILKKAAGTVLDERFATMSDAIARWWGSIRPEELVGFAGVKRRAAGTIFVNLVAALQSDLQGDAVERDALGVFSDSQLNALGLSTFLARTELVGSAFVFLDDPIPGSDGDHRLTFVQNTLADLLACGMQVVITTYDPKLAELAQTINERQKPITYDLALLNIIEGTEPSQTSDQFSNYMLQGEDGLNAPTAAGRRGACSAYRSAAERLAKQIIATNRTAAGIPTAVADVEKEVSMLGELIPLVGSLTLSPDEKGKWAAIPKVLNPGNHDDGAPSTIELKQIRGNLRAIAKAHHLKWGSDFVR